MKGIIVYGSLLNKKEIAKHCIQITSLIPIQLKNYKRLFNQLPSYRKGVGNKKGVLSIIHSPSSFLNAIVITLEDNEFEAFDKRESGYIKTKIDVKDIVPYKTYTINKNIPYFTYIGKDIMRDNTIQPNDEYLQICLDGASDMSKEFYNDFLESTYLGCGKILKEYLE